MASATRKQDLQTRDGTVLVIDSWLEDENSVAMGPGVSSFTATCPVHGKLDTSYISTLTGYAVQDHADLEHNGLRSPEDLLEIGPYIQM